MEFLLCCSLSNATAAKAVNTLIEPSHRELHTGGGTGVQLFVVQKLQSIEFALVWVSLQSLQAAFCVHCIHPFRDTEELNKCIQNGCVQVSINPLGLDAARAVVETWNFECVIACLPCATHAMPCQLTPLQLL